MQIISLKHKTDFLRLHTSKNKFFANCAIIVAGITPNVENNSSSSIIRVGFIVTKKIGNAVQRNRARRRLKAALKKAYTIHPIAGLDVIFIAKKAAVNIKFADMVDSLVQGLQKLQLQHENK